MTNPDPIYLSAPASCHGLPASCPYHHPPDHGVQRHVHPVAQSCVTGDVMASPAIPIPTSDAASPIIQVSIDGACIRNGRPDAQGGWAVVFDDGREFSGFELGTTNIRMEMKAAIVALRATPIGAAVVVHTDLKLLLRTMRDGWKQKCNHDLWGDIQVLADARSVTWRLVRGHSGHLGNERANRLAQVAARGGRANRIGVTAPS